MPLVPRNFGRCGSRPTTSPTLLAASRAANPRHDRLTDRQRRFVQPLLLRWIGPLPVHAQSVGSGCPAPSSARGRKGWPSRLGDRAVSVSGSRGRTWRQACAAREWQRDPASKQPQTACADAQSHPRPPDEAKLHEARRYAFTIDCPGTLVYMFCRLLTACCSSTCGISLHPPFRGAAFLPDPP